MSRFKPYSRREFRRRFTSWAKLNLKLVLLLTVGGITLVAVETLLLASLGSHSAFSWWMLGVLQTGVVAAYLHLLHAGFLAYDREAIRHLRGAWGEDNTRSELHRAKRKRLIWDWVDSISLQNGDLDHLVVTRRAGLVAIDSKWRNEAADTADMARAAHRAKLRAEGLARTLLKSDFGGRHRAKSASIQVTPVVVLWGAAQSGVPANARIDGIDFVAGRHLLGWLARLDHEPVAKAAARDIVNRLEEFRAGSWSNTDVRRRTRA